MVIGAVLTAGAAAPKMVTREHLKRMKPGSVLVDVSIDQGGCFETSRPTTHAEPTYVVDGVVHYCVANMPGAVARTATYALNAATLPEGYRKTSKAGVCYFTNIFGEKEYRVLGRIEGRADAYYPAQYGKPKPGGLPIDISKDSERFLNPGEKKQKLPLLPMQPRKLHFGHLLVYLSV